MVLLISSTSSLPPENQLMDLHNLEMQVKPHHLPPPFEDTHNSITPSGREVEPYPPQVIQSTTPAGGNSTLRLSHNAVSSLQDLQESSLLTGQVLEPAHVYESVKNKSSVVPRKGVKDPKPSVVARKGVGDIEVTTVSDAGPVESETISGLDSGTASQASISLEVTTLHSTTQFGGRERLPNDIQKPPVKLATTEKIVQQSELKPVAIASTTAAVKAATKAPSNDGSKSHAVHSKPNAAVDSNPNGKVSTSLVVGIMFGVLLIMVLAILGYKKLQDIWTKRHYARMDYLVDGMYDL
ncbi:hypothetical protein FHG87_012254 [Trinorchestia longiramus]|nr:hypothetical protein FHG87_012254 [Trinorchestia longiramus]